VGHDPIGVVGVGSISNRYPRESAWEVAAADVWSSIVGHTMMERGRGHASGEALRWAKSESMA
jgi:hypothetical protein